MPTSTLNKSAFIFALSSFLLLTACGGGSSSNNNNIDAPGTAASLTLSYGVKSFDFTWTDVENATHYKLLENPDGNSGFSQVGNDVPQGAQTLSHRVALYARINARYILQSCNAAGCTDSEELAISGTLSEAIGFIKAGNTGADENFGVSVSISDDGQTLAVSAHTENSSTMGIDTTPDDNSYRVGAVYVFFREDNSWSQQAYIKASNAGMSDYFGISVSLSGDGNTLAVGAHGEASSTTGINNTPNNGASVAGAVYVFGRSNGSWSEQAFIKASNAAGGDYFGFSVSLSTDGNTLAVGAHGEKGNGTSPSNNSIDGAGAAYVFVRGASGWAEQAYVKASNPGTYDSFGYRVVLSGDGNNLAVGAPNKSSGTGAVYVFVRDNDSWTEQAYIKASDVDTSDNFGASISLSADGNTLAVGAPREDSATTDINSTPNDDGTADDSGAAYVFTRDNTTGEWSQQAYIKASNSGAGDQFGRSLSLSKDGMVLAISALFDDSVTTGLETAPDDDGTADDSGAVYIFVRNASSWLQTAYIKASNTGADDRFGGSTSFNYDGSALAVGAYGEASDSTGIGGSTNDNAVNSGAVYLY